jgi:hypothetical protein
MSTLHTITRWEKDKCTTITPQGESSLAKWIESLRQWHKEIETMEAVNNAVKKNN